MSRQGSLRARQLGRTDINSAMQHLRDFRAPVPPAVASGLPEEVVVLVKVAAQGPLCSKELDEGEEKRKRKWC